MKTLAQIGYDILEMVTNYRITDDERVPIELIYEKIHDERAKMLEDYVKKHSNIPPDLYCPLKCVNIECRDIECNGIKTGDKEYYAVLENLDLTVNEYAIKFLGTIDRKISFRKMNFKGAMGPGTKNKPSYMILDSVNVILGEHLPTEGMKQIGVIYMCDMSKSCDADQPYPIKRSWVARIQKNVFNSVIAPSRIKRDEKLNTTDDV